MILTLAFATLGFSRGIITLVILAAGFLLPPGQALAAPSAPSLRSPTHGSNVSGDVILFQWYTVGSATDYYLEVATNPFFSDLVFAQWLGNYSGVSMSNYPDNGQTYYWRVKARDAKGLNRPIRAPGM